MSEKTIMLRLNLTMPNAAKHQKITVNRVVLEPIGICKDSQPHQLTVKNEKGVTSIQCETCGLFTDSEAVLKFT
jgi:hypothetical protein